MKIAFRNFLTTLRRYKVSSLLNVIGLTLAFTAFYVIMTQVWWELGYNRSLHEADRIYLVENEDWYEPGKWSSWLNRPVPERVIASTAGVEARGLPMGRLRRRNLLDAQRGFVRIQQVLGFDRFPVVAAARRLRIPFRRRRRARPGKAEQRHRFPQGGRTDADRRGQPHMGRYRRTPA